MCRCMRSLFLRIVSAVAAVAAVCSAACAQSPQAGTALQITLDAEAVEIIRAARRQQGIDPPDAAADARVAALLQRVAAEQQPKPTRASPQLAARARP